MKKKLIIILSAIAATAILGGAAIAYAAPNADTATRGAGNCFGFASSGAESFEDFQQDKIDRVEELVDDGTLTKDEGDAIIENIENCDGDGTCVNREDGGLGLFGPGAGNGQGMRHCNGNSSGNGNGNGNCPGNGVCRR